MVERLSALQSICPWQRHSESNDTFIWSEQGVNEHLPFHLPVDYCGSKKFETSAWTTNCGGSPSTSTKASVLPVKQRNGSERSAWNQKLAAFHQKRLEIDTLLKTYHVDWWRFFQKTHSRILRQKRPLSDLLSETAAGEMFFVFSVFMPVWSGRQNHFAYQNRRWLLNSMRYLAEKSAELGEICPLYDEEGTRLKPADF